MSGLSVGCWNKGKDAGALSRVLGPEIECWGASKIRNKGKGKGAGLSTHAEWGAWDEDRMLKLKPLCWGRGKLLRV